VHVQSCESSSEQSPGRLGRWTEANRAAAVLAKLCGNLSQFVTVLLYRDHPDVWVRLNLHSPPVYGFGLSSLLWPRLRPMLFASPRSQHLAAGSQARRTPHHPGGSSPDRELQRRWSWHRMKSSWRFGNAQSLSSELQQDLASSAQTRRGKRRVTSLLERETRSEPNVGMERSQAGDVHFDGRKCANGTRWRRTR
jgi:hypothetical protein